MKRVIPESLPLLFRNDARYFKLPEHHDITPGEAMQDSEGVQIMEVLGNNMAWQLKLREMTKDTLPAPAKIQKVMTNFIR
jgi:hypothetical protein